MFLGSKFVFVNSGDEEEDIVTGNVSSEEEDDQIDDGEVRAVLVTKCSNVQFKINLYSTVLELNYTGAETILRATSV